QNLDEILSNDEIQEDILEKFEEIPDSESANIIEINENRSKKNLNISNPIKIKRLVLLFLNTFSKSLEKYWLVFSNVGLLATLLDLHSKKLICFEKSLIDSIFGEEENEDNEHQISDDIVKLSDKCIYNVSDIKDLLAHHDKSRPSTK
ncbi:15874_t:CDS:2, partial [Rhizophagus irregularis]